MAKDSPNKPEIRKTLSGHPHSSAGDDFDWACSQLPHPESPASPRFNWLSIGVPHPSSPRGEQLVEWNPTESVDRSKPKSIAEVCEANWAANKSDCSAFVKAVAADLGIQLTGLANDIVDQVGRSPWVSLKKDGVAARSRADAGFFVIGGLKVLGGHGHVVVVTPGPLAFSKYPTAYWGRLNGTGKKNTTINFAWNEADRDKVLYFYLNVPE
jgi:hypothetical protein